VVGFVNYEWGQTMTTRGIEFLKEQGVSYEMLAYDYGASGARAAAEALGLPHAEVVKSLVFQSANRSFVFALIDGDGNISTRKLGRASGQKHIAASAPRDAERVTGYQVGGISPLGTRKALPVFLDKATASHDAIVLNAGARGTLVRVATADLIRLLNVAVVDLRSG